MNEPVKFRMSGTVTVKKYDGDAPKEGENKEPVEIVELVYLNDELVSKKIIKGDTNGSN
jgi:hypothetical protein